ncbi:hypothetical protein B9Z55_025804 [Caenorhabditis nigoni]|uniref:Uncharacterized protein n=1 Tax=Caenorhabditis nigoni TaxID=1611254 RepID=A0A2G5T0Q5_9PELO|nr:hypothetical protein B9Z55_025804 [Caenorhabditis nigoni]
MASRELESLYDYDYEEEEEEPYLYSPGATDYHDDHQDRMTVETEEISLPHRLEDTEYPVTQSVPFYSGTTNRAEYTWKVPHGREKRSNVPIETQTTYRNLFQELEIGKRQKLIQTCPAERLMHQTALLRKSRRENGHYFLSAETLRLSKSMKKTTTTTTTTNPVHPTPSLKEPVEK